MGIQQPTAAIFLIFQEGLRRLSGRGKRDAVYLSSLPLK